MHLCSKGERKGCVLILLQVTSALVTCMESCARRLSHHRANELTFLFLQSWLLPCQRLRKQ